MILERKKEKKKIIVQCPICEKVLCTIDEQTFKDKYQDYVCDYCKETLSSKRRLELEKEMMSKENYTKLVKNIENYRGKYE